MIDKISFTKAALKKLPKEIFFPRPKAPLYSYPLHTGLPLQPDGSGALENWSKIL